MLYVNNNDRVMAIGDWSVHARSRAFWYGDGVFESIRIRSGEPLNVDNHVKRLLQGAEVLKMRIPPYFTRDFFDVRIRELCKQSQIYKGGRCRLSIDRKDGGRYNSSSNDAQFFIEVMPLENNNFELNTIGLEIDIYTDIKKQKTFFSNFKTKNALLFVLASVKARELQLDEMLICNTEGNIIEATSSNLFVVSDDVLYTPSLNDGCLAGTMRMQIINLAIENGIRVYESAIFHQNLIEADEIFLTNAINGISWVGGYQTNRYFNTISTQLLNLIKIE